MRPSRADARSASSAAAAVASARSSRRTVQGAASGMKSTIGVRASHHEVDGHPVAPSRKTMVEHPDPALEHRAVSPLKHPQADGRRADQQNGIEQSWHPAALVRHVLPPGSYCRGRVRALRAA